MLSIGIDIGGTNTKILVVDLDSYITKQIIIKTPYFSNEVNSNILNYKKLLDFITSLLNKHSFNKIDKITISGQMHSTVILNNSNIEYGPLTWQTENFKNQTLLKSIKSRNKQNDIKRGYPIFNLENKVVGTYGTILTKLFGDLTGNYNLIHLSEAAGTGFYNLDKNNWDFELLKELNFSTLMMPKVISNLKFYKHKTFNTKISIPIGDFQMSMATNLSNRSNAISINIATGGQICIINKNKKPLFQTRPSLFRSIKYDCYTQLPAGRLINLLEKKNGKKRIIFNKKIYNTVKSCPELFTYSEMNNFIDCQLINTSHESIFHSILKKYVNLLYKYESYYQFDEIKLSGSILINYPFFSEGITYFFPEKKIITTDNDVMKKHEKLLLSII